jgi:photosystem II stability/assembly factor-like uncharacterized protein
MKHYLFFILSLATAVSVFGQKWENVSPTGYDYFTAMYFTNAEEGWVFAKNPEPAQNNYLLLHTVDGANSFSTIFSMTENLACWRFQMINNQDGYAWIMSTTGNDKCFLWKTTDGGNSWNDITDTAMISPSGPINGYPGIYFINKNTGFLGGENSIYKTTDGGNTWFPVNISAPIDSIFFYGYYVNNVYFTDSIYGWATGSAGERSFVMKTTDGGSNWSNCTPDVTYLYDILFIDSLKGGVTGHGSWGSALFGTENNFESISYGHDMAALLHTICYQNDSIIWASGFPAIIYRSTDGGHTFSEYDTSYATGNFGDDIWSIRFTGNTGYAFAISFLLKIVDTVNTSVPEISQTLPEIAILPNPAQDEITVSITTGKPAISKVSIYSDDGRLIRQLETPLSTGRNYIIMNINNLPSGVYLVNFRTQETSLTRRLIISN